MNVGIDVSPIIYGTGVSQYLHSLINSLGKIDNKNKYVLFGSSMRRFDDLNNQNSNFPQGFEKKYYRMPPTMLDILWNKFHVLPIEMLIGNVDVFHSSDWTQPPTIRAKRITTIHDLSPLVLWKTTNPRIVAAHRQRLYWVRREVDKVIAVSRATKKDIMHYLGIPEEKIEVIYEAPSPEFTQVEELKVKQVKRKFGIEGEYLLAVGTQPRKNLKRISKVIDANKDFPTLVIAGEKWEEIESQKIKWLGNFYNKDLVALYNGAQALVYVSLYEGFGLPILQAMACGCPVVTSSISSMPEISGNAAMLAHPEDTEEIEKGIRVVLQNRKQFIRKGFDQVKKFSWDKAARETLKVYEEALK